MYSIAKVVMSDFSHSLICNKVYFVCHYRKLDRHTSLKTEQNWSCRRLLRYQNTKKMFNYRHLDNKGTKDRKSQEYICYMRRVPRDRPSYPQLWRCTWMGWGPHHHSIHMYLNHLNITNENWSLSPAELVYGWSPQPYNVWTGGPGLAVWLSGCLAVWVCGPLSKTVISWLFSLIVSWLNFSTR